MAAYCASAVSADQPGLVRRGRQRATPGQIRRLAHPAPERQAGAVEEVQQLRNRVGSVLRMEQRIGQPCPIREVGRVAQERRKGMVRRERLEARSEVADLGRRPADAKAPTVVLKHIDPGAAIGRINHHVEGAVSARARRAGPAAPHQGRADGAARRCRPRARSFGRVRRRAPRRAGAPRGCRGRTCASALA